MDKSGISAPAAAAEGSAERTTVRDRAKSAFARLFRHAPVLRRLLGPERHERPPDVPFDPAAYLALNPDVALAQCDPLKHYLRHGRNEGRSNGIVAHPRSGGGPLFVLQDGGAPFDAAKDSCVIVTHESSRTGCPINTLSMLGELNKTHNVLAVSLQRGTLDPLFRAQSSHFAAFDASVGRSADFIELRLSGILSEGDWRFAVVNSAVSAPVLPVLARHRIPSIVCVHEFAQYCPASYLESVFSHGALPVYSSRLCLKSTADALGIDVSGVPVLPQGKSAPPAFDASSDERRLRTMDRLARAKNRE